MIETLDIAIERVAESRISELDENNIQFAKVYSDHMFEAHFKNGQWQDMVIKPYANLSISPANTTLHYGQSIFEAASSRGAMTLTDASHQALALCSDRSADSFADHLNGRRELSAYSSGERPDRVTTSIYKFPT